MSDRDEMNVLDESEGSQEAAIDWGDPDAESGYYIPKAPTLETQDDTQPVVETPEEEEEEPLEIPAPGESAAIQQELQALRRKAELYDALERDPRATLEYINRNYGQQAQGPPAQEQYAFTAPPLLNAEESMQDYLSRVFTEFGKSMRQDVAKGLQSVSASAREEVAAQARNAQLQSAVAGFRSHLNAHYPGWEQNGQAIQAVLSRHPSMLADPDAVMTLVSGSRKEGRSEALANRTQNRPTRTGARSTRPQATRPKQEKGFDAAWQRAVARASRGE